MKLLYEEDVFAFSFIEKSNKRGFISNADTVTECIKESRKM